MNIKYTDKSNTYIKKFSNEVMARIWIAKFNKTAKRLKKISHIKILDNFKRIEYKIIGVKIK